jgi:hypothetical protein
MNKFLKPQAPDSACLAAIARKSEFVPVLNEVRHEDISIAKLSNTPEMRIGGVEA